MAFDDVRLPVEVERGAVGGPSFQTSILTFGSGSEKRNSDWSSTRASYDVSYGIQYKEDFMDVVRFFYARRGRARGFRFKDWSDYQAENELIGSGDGTKTVFQLVKTYADVVSYIRNITRPVNGTVVLRVAGVPTVASVNHDTGKVTFSVAPAAAAPIRADFEFDVPVRFDTDKLDIDVKTFEAAELPSITLVELIEAV